ncbi:cysteine desulfurase family protein [Methylohalobius crimeensis]|uniref:cysteine desulfurase family protein n=1 Tax=Methylohalobius crimeensis TaxID=244365 RepID=UPI0003B301A6|nr:cysteine desulfurase family protein [Methylohalobius crimeensis]
MIYLDHNATTPLDERVVEAMLPFLHRFYGNPSSLYRWGRLTRDAVEQARVQVSALAGAHPSQVIFTSGGTEANNLALKGWCDNNPGKAIAVSAIEHASVRETAQALSRKSVPVHWLPVDADGVVQVDALAELPRNTLGLVSCMFANNETGVIQPLSKLVEIAAREGIACHTDAVQAVGRLPLRFNDSGVGMMSLSGHKVYGPKGVGALIVDQASILAPLLNGGDQEYGLRGGTENVAGIVGFGKAAELALAERESSADQLAALRERLEAGLARLPGVIIFGRDAERLPNTVQMTIPGMDGEMLVMALDREKIAVSSGSACASGGSEPSHVLLAMDVEEALAKGAIRISLGKDNTEQDVERFLSVLAGVVSAFGVGG